MSKRLYSFRVSCVVGNLSGLFVADQDAVTQAIGKTVRFGNVLDKPSILSFPLEESDLEIKSQDQDLIAKLCEIFGDTLSGYNPLHHLHEDGAEGNSEGGSEDGFEDDSEGGSADGSEDRSEMEVSAYDIGYSCGVAIAAEAAKQSQRQKVDDKGEKQKLCASGICYCCP